MDSLVDLVCFYYRKALLNPTPKILREIGRVPHDLYELICSLPTSRPFVQWSNMTISYGRSFLHAFNAIQQRNYARNSILFYPLRTNLLQNGICYYTDEYVSTVNIHHMEIPHSRPFTFKWGEESTLYIDLSI
jgi:hypothetical protein